MAGRAGRKSEALVISPLKWDIENGIQQDAPKAGKSEPAAKTPRLVLGS